VQHLEYSYNEPIKEYLKLASSLFFSLKDRGLIGLEVLSKSTYINENNNAIAFLLRNAISYVDAMGISASAPSVENMKLLARSFLENKCYLDYIFKDNTFERAIAYQNNYLIEKIEIYKKLDPKTDEGKRLTDIWKRDRVFSNIKRYEIDTIESIENLERQLNREPFKNVYEKQIARGNRSKWYSFDTGKNNFRELCDYLECQIQYEFFYKNWSGMIHSASVYENNIYHGEDGNGMESIRSINGFKDLIIVLYPLIIELYITVFKVADEGYYLRLIRYFKNIYYPLKEKILRISISVQT